MSKNWHQTFELFPYSCLSQFHSFHLFLMVQLWWVKHSVNPTNWDCGVDSGFKPDWSRLSKSEEKLKQLNILLDHHSSALIPNYKQEKLPSITLNWESLQQCLLLHQSQTIDFWSFVLKPTVGGTAANEETEYTVCKTSQYCFTTEELWLLEVIWTLIHTLVCIWEKSFIHFSSV